MGVNSYCTFRENMTSKVLVLVGRGQAELGFGFFRGVERGRAF